MAKPLQNKKNMDGFGMVKQHPALPIGGSKIKLPLWFPTKSGKTPFPAPRKPVK